MGDNLLVGGGLVAAAEPEERLEGGERLAVAQAPATTHGMASADVGLIDLDLAPERLTLGVDHRRRSFCRISHAVS